MDDYQEKLKNYIAEIPPHPAMVPSGPAMKPPYNDEFKKKLASNTTGLQTNKVFLKYTKTEHTSLLKDWNAGGIKTTCNEFMGHTGLAIGAKDFLGRFELYEFLAKIGKKHAYVFANSTNRPRYGDFVRFAHFHVGISLGFEGDTWLTVEAGQGGPQSRGFDAIMRKKEPWDPKKVDGWCDMKLYFDPRPAVPDWLVGTWSIICDNQTYYYHINQYYEAKQLPQKNAGEGDGAFKLDTGTVTMQGADSFTITWNMEGGTESFAYDRWNSIPGVNERITGKSRSGEQLWGARSSS